MRPLSSLQTLWKHRQLLWQFTVRQVELRHKGTHLGLVWSFLGPLLMVSLYVLVFGFIFGGRFQGAAAESRIEYALVLFLGLALYHFVAEVITVAPLIIVSNPNFVKKVVFPLEILAAANVGAAAIHFLITLGLVVLGALLGGVSLHAGIFWLPVIFLPLFLGVLGVSLALSALGVFWRDISQITQFLTLVLLFTSAVFYSVSQIPPFAWAFLKFNPLIHVIEQARRAIFWGLPVDLNHIVYIYVSGLAAAVVGGAFFQRLRSSFADAL
jgi:lipopolysaccharide transport system permease protein